MQEGEAVGSDNEAGNRKHFKRKQVSKRNSKRINIEIHIGQNNQQVSKPSSKRPSQLDFLAKQAVLADCQQHQ